MPRRRKDEREDEQEGAVEVVEGAGGDLGTMLLDMQEGTGNASVAQLLEQVEKGEVAPEAILPETPRDKEQREEERLRKGVAERSTFMSLTGRIRAARMDPFAARLAGEITAVERRVLDAREYGWLGTDADVLGNELRAVEHRLVQAAAEEQATQALARVDATRLPVSRRLKTCMTQYTALHKPGIELYAPEDAELLAQTAPKLTELQKLLADNRDSVVRTRETLGQLSDVATAGARDSAGSLQLRVDELSLQLEEIEGELGEITERHARVGIEDREALNKLMEGLKPPLAGVPRKAMASGAGRQEIEYLVKKSWLDQYEESQKLNRDELWQLLTGHGPNEGKVHYYDLPQRMGNARIHFSLDYGVMKACDVAFTEPDIRDALLGATAGVVMRAHATAEVLGPANELNPHYYYGTSGATPRREFWSTPQGKEAHRNWDVLERQLMEAFDGHADQLVKLVYDILRARQTYKARVIQVNESLVWAD
jgi:hypothetical protein